MTTSGLFEASTSLFRTAGHSVSSDRMGLENRRSSSCLPAPSNPPRVDCSTMAEWPRLELGSGFHEDLTGEDNVRLGCSVLGISPSEIESVLPDIVDFSELGDFVKCLIKTYSTGMYLRLGFSIIISVNPDILVVDEALAVGDQHFQKKCVDRMNAFRDAGKTLVFCSHSMYLVRQLCEQTLWLKGEDPRCSGPRSR